jgi:ATP adenylyltransferase
VFLDLLDLCVSTIRHDSDYPAGRPSYNVLITLEHMHLIPRRNEDYVLGETGEKLSVNAMGFAGMLLVKNEDELEALRKEEIGKVLRGVGLESVHELQVAGTSLEPGDVDGGSRL